MELIVSRYRYVKEGRHYRAGIDPATATVRVLQGGTATTPHRLPEHFERTTQHSSEHITALVDAALARTASTEARGRGVRAFTFMPTSRCNMGCAYCGQIHQPGSTPPTVSARFLDRIRSAFAAPGVREVHVAWFGGEPLLAYRLIIELSTTIVALAEESGRTYTSKITTNGALLTPARMRRLIEDAHVSRFDITLDGPAEVHNRHRPLTSGGVSFDTIVQTLDWFRDAELSRPAIVVLRTNVGKVNLPFVAEYLHTMKERGFDDPRRFLYEISPIHSWGSDVSTLALTTPEAARHEVEWMELMERLGLPYGLLPGRPAERTCVATDPHCEVVDSRGNLFSCTEYPLTPQSGTDRLGNILTLPVLDQRPRGRFDHWEEAIAQGRLPCSTCQIQAICRGACPKQWSEGRVPCPTLKLNLDDRMAIFMRRYGYRAVDAG